MHRFLLITLVVFSVCSAEVTHSVMPIMEKIENSPVEKFSESYISLTNEMLTKKLEKIRVVTYNVLFNVFDSTLENKSHTWAARLPLVVQTIENMNPDILCLQESYFSQIQDLGQALGSRYAYFMGSSTTGELNAIFYNKDRFELDAEMTSLALDLPLNPKDEIIVSKIPDFLPPDLEPGRQLVLAQLHDKLTDKKFVVMNTHLTYYRLNSREDQAKFITRLATHFQGLNKNVILTGDFNTFPNRPDHNNVRFYDGTYICRLFECVFKDTNESALLGHIGPLCSSVSDFSSRNERPFEESEHPGVLPDHIYVSPEIIVILHAIEPGQVNNQFPSDHLPVIADIILP